MRFIRYDVVKSNAINSASDWLQATFLGTLATSTAIVAIASIGFLMLSGRIDVRRSAQAIFGCFMIFGASTVAAGIVSAVPGRSASDAVAQAPTPPQSLPTPPAYPNANASAFDPYAGAAVPSR